LGSRNAGRPSWPPPPKIATKRPVVGPFRRSCARRRPASPERGAWRAMARLRYPQRMAVCDLRSDTLTRPTPAMRAAMAAAEVGDDVYGEDPSVRALEERVAALLGKESALFVPSGTMGNQIGLLVHTRPGDEVIIGEGSHCAFYESGAAAAWSGVQFAVAGHGGLFT